MKRVFYLTLIGISTLVTSCTSVQELVDKGQYDEAIYLAANKLAGQKNSKTKHVKALEEAFVKVNAFDLDEIAYLKAKKDPAIWDRIYDITLKIERRQNRVKPFLPLVSKDGYFSQFDFVDTRSMKLEAGQYASEYHFQKAKDLLVQAEQGDKLAAKTAYGRLEDISRYYQSYKDVENMMERAHLLGTTHILVNLDRSYDNILGLPQSGSNIFAGEFQDKFWVNYHDNRSNRSSYDLVATLFIDGFDISPEREEINRYVENKTIEKWIDKLDRRGNPVKDSLGNVIQIKKVDVLEAKIQEIVRTKSALVAGRAEIRDYITDKIISSQPMEVVIDFRSEAFDISGDREALSDRVRKRIDHYIEPFPANWAMAQDASRKLLYAYEDFLSQVKY